MPGNSAGNLPQAAAGLPQSRGPDDAGATGQLSSSPAPTNGSLTPAAPVIRTGGLDTAALRETIALVDGQLDELTQHFYAVLFTTNPDLRDLFPADMAQQRTRFAGSIMHIVAQADDRPAVTAYLESLARSHRKYAVQPEQYRLFGPAFIAALRRVVGRMWSDRYEAAWEQAFNMIASTMIEASDRDAVITPPWWDAEVVFHRRVLSDVAIIQVRPHTDYPYRPGQYCYVMSPRRPKMWRAYSMACAPRHDGLLEFHVRAIGAGWVSSALVWRTDPGDILRLSAPDGHDLANPKSERDLLCIAGGTGIAPMLSGLQELEHRQDGRRVHVFYAGRDRDSLYALPHLESIGMRYRKLTVVPVVSPEGPDDRSPDLMGNIVSAYGDWRRHHVHVAGPTVMVQATLNRLHEQGVPAEHITCDDYGH